MMKRFLALLLLAALMILPIPTEAACTFTTNLNLCKPVVGDIDWGVNLNANFDKLDSPVKLVVSGAGPHAIGGATVAGDQLLLTGTFNGTGATSQAALDIRTSVSGGVPGESIFGIRVLPTLVEASSGTHSLVAGLVVAPTITAGLASVTDAAGIIIQSFAAASGTTNASGLKIEGTPTGATNNYALWVMAGNIRVGGNLARPTNTNLGPGMDFGSDTVFTFRSGTTAFRWMNQANTDERLRLTDNGILALGTTVVTGAAAGDYVAANGVDRWQAVNAAGTAVLGLMGLNGSNELVLNQISGRGDTTGVVSQGAVDSGGAGFRTLRVPN